MIKAVFSASLLHLIKPLFFNTWEIHNYLQHPSHPQSPLHCRWSHPPDTQLLQSATIREETAESPGQDQQTEGQLHPSGCQEAELPPPPPPPPPLHHHHHHHHHHPHRNNVRRMGESRLLFHSSSADLRTHAQFVVLSATLQSECQNKSPFFLSM